MSETDRLPMQYLRLIMDTQRELIEYLSQIDRTLKDMKLEAERERFEAKLNRGAPRSRIGRPRWPMKSGDR